MPRKNFEDELEKLLASLGYSSVGTTGTILQQFNCCNNVSKINVKLTLLEATQNGSYFIFMPVKWHTAVNLSPDEIVANCQPFVPSNYCYVNRELKITGIKQLSSDVQTKKTIVHYKNNKAFNAFSNYCSKNFTYNNTNPLTTESCNQFTHTPSSLDTNTFYVGTSYYTDPNSPFPMLVHNEFDKLELEINLEATYLPGNPAMAWAETYLEISDIQVFYFNQDVALNSISMILTLAGFVLGML